MACLIVVVIMLGLVSADNYAYVTLLGGRKEFEIGAEMLVYSLKKTQTKHPILVLDMKGVSRPDRLARLGAKVVPIKEIAGETYQRDFQFYTKIHLWSMTDYDRLVFIDSDALVLRNVDQLFQCKDFCAATRHSDLFNSGVMVLSPSEEVYARMFAKKSTLPTYDGADQGFFNSFFPSLKSAPLFGDNNDTSCAYRNYRLPAEYNADIGMFMLNSGFRYQPAIIHYTLGPTKPWHWFYQPIIPPHRTWNSYRNEMCAEFGCEWEFSLWLVCAPALVWISILAFWLRKHNKEECPSKKFGQRFPRGLRAWLVFLAPTTILFLATYLAFEIVPSTTVPQKAFPLFLFWTFSFQSWFWLIFDVLCKHSDPLSEQNHGLRLAKIIISSAVIVLFYYLLWTLCPLFHKTGHRAIVIIAVFSLATLTAHGIGQNIIKPSATPQLEFFVRERD